MRGALAAEVLTIVVLLPSGAAEAAAQSRPEGGLARVTKDAPTAAGRGRPLPTVAGLYRALQVSQGGSCAPRQLPRPTPNTLADTLGYFPAPAAAADSVRFWIRVSQTASGMSWTPSQDSLGTTSVASIPGTIRPDGTFTNGGAVVPMGLEAGPREGGLRLFGTQSGTAQGRFDDAGGTVRLSGTGALTFRFIEGSENGAVYTTCTIPFTLSASRVAP